MWISRYACLFVIYSFLGWVYETIYCTVKGGKWENRGFLFGPVCPIYGTGAIAISAVMSLTAQNSIELSAWQIFLISVVGSAVLEFVTSWVLEKTFHALWWDYSKLPFNIQGRISLFTSLGFGVAGLLIVYYIAPATEEVMVTVPSIMTELLSLILIFLFAADLTLTVVALYHFEKVVARVEDSFNNGMEAIVDSTVQRTQRVKLGIIERHQYVNDQLDQLSGYIRGTVNRIHSFRQRDGLKEKIRNRFLLSVRGIASEEEEEKDA
jgi:uncharacterized membrane protein